MITASARTDSLGRTISNLDSAYSSLTCKTEHFVIEKPTTQLFNLEQSMCRLHPEAQEIGAHLGGSLEFADVIARHLFENGVSLNNPCMLMYYQGKTSGRLTHQNLELWTQQYRFKLMGTRVYGQKLKKDYWHYFRNEGLLFCKRDPE